MQIDKELLEKAMTNPYTPSDAAVAQAFRESMDSINWNLYTGTDLYDWIAERAAQLHANATTERKVIHWDMDGPNKWGAETAPPVAAAPVVDAYTAHDIAQASADGFRAGVASVAAPAADVRGDWVVIGETFGGSAYLNADGLFLPDGTKLYAAAPKPEGA